MLGLAKLKGQGIFLINVSRREKGKTKLNKETEKQKGAELFKLKKKMLRQELMVFEEARRSSGLEIRKCFSLLPGGVSVCAVSQSACS